MPQRSAVRGARQRGSAAAIDSDGAACILFPALPAADLICTPPCCPTRTATSVDAYSGQWDSLRTQPSVRSALLRCTLRTPLYRAALAAATDQPSSRARGLQTVDSRPSIAPSRPAHDLRRHLPPRPVYSAPHIGLPRSLLFACHVSLHTLRTRSHPPSLLTAGDPHFTMPLIRLLQKRCHKQRKSKASCY